MSTIDQDPRLRLLKIYGGIAKIPDNILKEEGLRRLYNEEKASYSLVTEADYEKRQRECFGILKAYEGYIFAGHLSRIYKFLNGEEMVSEDVLRYARARGEKFKEANIPPIFNREFYTPSSFEYPDLFGEENIERKRRENLFPSIDFIIQYATGAYERKRVAIATEFRKKTGENKGGIPIQPATVKDVQDFRRVAFTPDGKISTLLIRETEAYQRKHFKVSTEERREKYAEIDRMIFLYLEEMLKDFPVVEEQKYIDWDRKIDVVQQPRWYLSFRPEDRIKMACAFFESIKAKPTGKSRDVFASMKVLFPEMAERAEATIGKLETERIEQEIQQSITQAEANGDYSKVPQKAFTEEPWRNKYLPQLEQFFVSACGKLLAESPSAFFTDVGRFYTKVPVPRRLLIVPHFRDLFDDFRLRAVRQLTDDQFRELFMGNTGRLRYHNIGRGGAERGADKITELRDYLQGHIQVLDGS